jgi:hypothetical protein
MWLPLFRGGRRDVQTAIVVTMVVESARRRRAKLLLLFSTILSAAAGFLVNNIGNDIRVEDIRSGHLVIGEGVVHKVPESLHPQNVRSIVQYGHQSDLNGQMLWFFFSFFCNFCWNF